MVVAGMRSCRGAEFVRRNEGWIMQASVDVEGEWRRSSVCPEGTCVEVRAQGNSVELRDSKQIATHTLLFSSSDWPRFLNWAISLGEEVGGNA